MVIRWKRSICLILGGLFAALALLGCEVHPCPEPSLLERATSYPHKFVPPGSPPGPPSIACPSMPGSTIDG